MTRERWWGEVDQNAGVIHDVRELLATGILAGTNIKLVENGSGMRGATILERSLHRRQVELQKSGIKPRRER